MHGAHMVQKTTQAVLPLRADGGQCSIGGHTWESAIMGPVVGIFVVLLWAVEGEDVQASAAEST